MQEEGQKHHLLKCAEGGVYVHIWETGCEDRRTSETENKGNSTLPDTELELV